MRGRGEVKQAAGRMCLENRGEKGPGGLIGCLWHRNDNGGQVTSGDCLESWVEQKREEGKLDRKVEKEWSEREADTQEVVAWGKWARALERKAHRQLCQKLLRGTIR